MSRFEWLEIPELGGEKKPEVFFPPLEVEKDANYYLNSAEKRFYEGYFEPALKDYSTALRYDRSAINAWVGQVRALVAMQELKEATVWADKALSLFPRSADVLAAKAQVLNKLGKAKEALPYSDTSLGYEPASEYVWLVRGDILLSLRQVKTADYCLKKVLEGSQNWQLLLQIGIVYLDHRRYPEAASFISKSAAINTINAFIWLKLGESYRGMHLKSTARSYYQKALELRPSYQEVEKALKESGRYPCLIATVAFGSETAREVEILRDFRDSIMCRSPYGRVCIFLYQRISPLLAPVVSQFDFLKRIVRLIVKIFLILLKKQNVMRR